MIRISLDAEFEQPNTHHETPDSALSKSQIIQIGYVIFDDQNGTILKENSKHINIGVKISKFIKDLTGITDEDIANGTTLESVIDELHQDVITYNTSRKILTWGAGDQEAIRDELKVDYPWKLGRSAFNVKHLYQLFREVNGLNHSGGLAKSMTKLGLRFQGTKHDALDDAINTAIIFRHLADKLKTSS
jgi:inhibitor of KinA sporulation pathway (predicted exonuclease)